MSAFQLSDDDWKEIARDLKKDDGFNDNAARGDLNLHCNHFTQLRSRMGKNLPTPDKAREAWREIAAAAKRLQLAIEKLRKAGAADFSFIGSSADAWAAQIPHLILAAEWAVGMEHVLNPSVANNVDPPRDGFVEILVRVWRSYRQDERISTAENGPLMRFLVAVTTPTYEALGETPPTEGELRGILRKLRDRASSAQQ